MTDTPSGTQTTDDGLGGEASTGHGGSVSVWQYVNSATLRGAIALLLGLSLLLLPRLSFTLVEFVIGLAVLTAGLFDLWFAVTGRRHSIAPESRFVALLRGLLSLAFTANLVLTPDEALAALVELVGLYLLVRGAIAVLSLLRRGTAQRGPRLASGLTATAFGVICVSAPTTVAEGVVVVGATAAVVLGGIVMTYGLRKAHQGRGWEGTSASVTEILWDWIRGAEEDRAVLTVLFQTGAPWERAEETFAQGRM